MIRCTAPRKFVRGAIRHTVRAGLLAAALTWLMPARAQPEPLAQPTQQPTQQLHIVGALAGLNQYVRHEEPFWTTELPRLSGGRLQAEIMPFDRAGIRAQEMLRLMGLGVVPFGTALLSASVAEMPIVAAPDLAGLNPDMASLRRTVAAFRPHLESALKQRYGIEVLAVYTYPAQVVFCKQAFKGLDGLAGRRVRVSNPSMADLVRALGAEPVQTSFADILVQMRGGNLDCAITGTMSGNTIGLPDLTGHLHSMALSWGLGVFGANGAAWKALGAENQALLRRELPRLEAAIWAESDRESMEGLACNTGAAACRSGKRGQMQQVQASPADEKRRRLLFAQTVLPKWLLRCGPECAEVWNSSIGPTAGIEARAP